MSQCIAVNSSRNSCQSGCQQFRSARSSRGNPRMSWIGKIPAEYPLSALRSSCRGITPGYNPASAADLTSPYLRRVAGSYPCLHNHRVTCPRWRQARCCIYNWRKQALNTLENAIRNSASGGTTPSPSSHPNGRYDFVRCFQWTGIVATQKSHTNKIACQPTSKRNCRFLDMPKT